jgi:adenylate kinase
MKRILLTGMSGTGKSSVISELAARGYKAIDADINEWSEWAPYVAIPDLPEANEPELEWIWRADRIRDLRRRAIREIDTDMPLEDVVAAVLKIVEEPS